MHLKYKLFINYVADCTHTYPSKFNPCKTTAGQLVIDIRWVFAEFSLSYGRQETGGR